MNGLLKLSSRLQRTVPSFTKNIHTGLCSTGRRPVQIASHFNGFVLNVKYLSSVVVRQESLETSVVEEPRESTSAQLQNMSMSERQRSIELGLIEKRNTEQATTWGSLKLMGKGTSVKRAQEKISEWHYPLSTALMKEQELINKKVTGVDRQIYGPYFSLVAPEKLAIIALERVMSGVIQTDNSGVASMRLALELGNAIERQVMLDKVKGKDLTENTKQFLNTSRRNYVKVQRVMKRQDPWSTDIKIKLGSVLLKSMIVSCLTEDNRRAFDSVMSVTHPTGVDHKARHMNEFKMTDDYFRENFKDIVAHVPPTYPPMLIPPRPWNNHELAGAYTEMPAPLMKHVSRKQTELSQKADMPCIIDGLNYLGSVPWRINEPMLDIILKVRREKLLVGEVHPGDELKTPTYEEFFKDVLKNPEILKSRFYVPNVDDKEEFASQAKKYYKGLKIRHKKKNAEMHSMKCDVDIKLSIAQEYRKDTLYFPHNLDFRGRAYPVPPNLNHLGSDLCRSLLVFGEGLPLGERGFRWLKIHISNLCGYNKVSFDDRVAWVESQMANITASADEPFGGDMWWSKQESPFQVLAASKELVAALRSPNPLEFVSNLPVHQDGSCNGLQHYASLGRDYNGGKAVNLMDAEIPQDVYTSVLDVVRRKIQADAESQEMVNEDPKDTFRRFQAMRVRDIVNRKVIKQTVMTSVYGVTFIGAKEQIKARLYEAFDVDPALLSQEADREFFAAAGYLATITMESIGEVFSNAKKIMDWLGTVSHMIAKTGHGVSWITPLGLPVLQPYKTKAGFIVKTVLQNVCIASNVESLPVNTAKQKSAFPPNFVHSLDATHMFITSLKMKESGLFFAAVHDSYWTHPCHVDIMREHLRTSFVDLYEKPVLEDFRDSIVMRYPSLNIPPLPKPGRLNLQDVKSSTYFFH